MMEVHRKQKRLLQYHELPRLFCTRASPVDKSFHEDDDDDGGGGGGEGRRRRNSSDALKKRVFSLEEEKGLWKESQSEEEKEEEEEEREKSGFSEFALFMGQVVAFPPPTVAPSKNLRSLVDGVEEEAEEEEECISAADCKGGGRGGRHRLSPQEKEEKEGEQKMDIQSTDHVIPGGGEGGEKEAAGNSTSGERDGKWEA